MLDQKKISQGTGVTVQRLGGGKRLQAPHLDGFVLKEFCGVFRTKCHWFCHVKNFLGICLLVFSVQTPKKGPEQLVEKNKLWCYPQQQ